MSKFATVFVSESYRRLVVLLIWALSLLLATAVLAWFAAGQIRTTLGEGAEKALADFAQIRTNAAESFDILHKNLRGAPCSDEFIAEMRRVAFLPDGINEFLYAPNGNVHCTAGGMRFAEPLRLGEPDIQATARHGAMWIDRDLTFLGLSGLTGSIMTDGNLAAILPPQKLAAPAYPFGAIQAVLTYGGKAWHRAGPRGIYEQVIESNGFADWMNLPRGAFTILKCDDDGLACIAGSVAVADVIAHEKVRVAFAAAVALSFAIWMAWLGNTMIRRHWAFEARFVRTLDEGSIVLAYQPVVHLQSGKVVGCEVLARWRDVDDTIVYPDTFIATVEKRGMTEYFTRLVAARAFAELCETMPRGERLQVNFNIFPRDLDAALLQQIFAPFRGEPDRFDVVLEIVESDALSLDRAYGQIEALKAAGIGVYVDDFGTGYSNLSNLVALPMDGIKLDRSFAMAPAGSLMSQMFEHAIDMIHATGRKMVIEGIETPEHLEALRLKAEDRDYGQGYGIARPLSVAMLASYVSSHRPRPLAVQARRPRKATLRQLKSA